MIHSEEFSVPVMSEDVHRLINHLNLPEGFTLMGHSLGGKVAMHMALTGKF